MNELTPPPFAFGDDVKRERLRSGQRQPLSEVTRKKFLHFEKSKGIRKKKLPFFVFERSNF